MKKNSNCQTKLFWQNLKKSLRNCKIDLNKTNEIIVFTTINTIVADMIAKSNFGFIAFVILSGLILVNSIRKQ